MQQPLFTTPFTADEVRPLSPNGTSTFSPNGDETFSCEIERVIYHNPANGFFVAAVRAGTRRLTVTGTTMFLSVGTSITVTGKWVDDPKWGQQFKAARVSLSDQSKAMQILLGSGFLKGVKMHMAEQIARAFGDETFTHLDEALDNPKKLTVVKGIGNVNCHMIAKSWKEQRHWANAALVSVRAGLNVRQAKEAYNRWGNELVKVINDNPYMLSVLNGIDWTRMDEIAALSWPGKQPIGHDDPRRYGAAVREALRVAYNEGHMALLEEDALAKARELAQPTLPGFEDKVRARYTGEYLVLHDGKYLYQMPYWQIERDTAEAIARLMDRSTWRPVADWSTIDLAEYTDLELSGDQVDAVRQSLQGRILVITGGPGVGKTTVLKTICNIFAAHGLSLTLCAPTGKAARRMSDATGMSAATIHRTLGIYGDGGRKYNFQTSAVLIDEASMIDAALMREVVQACGTQTRLILIGDVDQLPPVGAGEPFYQVIQSGVPVVRLNVIHRQGKDSGIIVAAHTFNRGEVADVADYEDIRIDYVAANNALPDRMLWEVNRLILLRKLTIQDVQVLTPLNNHEWGQHKLNVQLQDIYNPGPFPLKGCPFKEGDKVIHIKNVYDMRGQTVLNGMVGTVTRVLTTAEEKALDDRRKEEGNPDLPEVVWVRFDGEFDDTTYTREEIGLLKLAYALTVHKSQGSEYPFVVLVVPGTHPGFMMRQLAYTGLTRAKKYCSIISAQSALETYVQNEERVRRVTFLAEMIRQAEVSAPIWGMFCGRCSMDVEDTGQWLYCQCARAAKNDVASYPGDWHAYAVPVEHGARVELAAAEAAG